MTTSPAAANKHEKKHDMNPLVKLAIEAGPLVVFFTANAQKGIIWATGAFMVAITVALAANWLLAKRIPTLPLVTAVFVLVFGGLTIYLNDATFIKLKPTIVNSLFAAILLGGMLAGKSFLKSVIGEMFALTDRGWRLLTYRWGFFFIALAVANEIVWRNFSDDFWVDFKVFGIMPLTLIFSVAQLPLMNRHAMPEDATAEDTAGPS
jgi:intracellular septation protein